MREQGNIDRVIGVMVTDKHVRHLVRGNALFGKDFLPFVNPNGSKFLPPLHDRLTMNPARIIARPMTQHGHEDTPQSVAHTA
jgi:hypothetical protein